MGSKRYPPPTRVSPLTSANTDRSCEGYDDMDSLFGKAQPCQEPATPGPCQTNTTHQLNGVAINEDGECMYLNWDAMKSPTPPPNGNDLELQESTTLVPFQTDVTRWLNQVPVEGIDQYLSPDLNLIKRPASPAKEDDQPLPKKRREETKVRSKQTENSRRGNKHLSIVIGEGKVTVSSKMEYPGQIRIDVSSGDQEMMDMSMSDTQSVEKEDLDSLSDDEIQLAQWR